MTPLPNLDEVRSYFEKRLQEYGASPRGVDWNSAESQNTRFDQLLKVIEGDEPFSLLDYGCGYGALAGYLAAKGIRAGYFGYDIVEISVETARKLCEGKPGCLFSSDKAGLPVCDYTVSSGIFNYRGTRSFDSWTELLLSTLDEFDRLSRRGFACNFLTSYSDADEMQADLYYADPLLLFDHCKRYYSKNVALLHDYRLYDFTIIVRKDSGTVPSHRLGTS